MKPRYSGKKSVRFWKRVNAVKPRARMFALYREAVTLQDLEHKVLQNLRAAEQARKP